MKDGVKGRYTLEFKREAVRLVHGGEKVWAAARTLGVSGQTLDNWVKAEAAGRLRDVRGKAVTAEQMEIARLKAELPRVRMERDIVVPGRSWSSAVSCRSAPAAIISIDCGKPQRLVRNSQTAGSATRPWRCTSRRSSPR